MLPEIPAGETVRLPVQIRNASTVAWSAACGDAVAYHWFDGDGRVVQWDGRRTPVDRLEPGATATLDLEVLGPPGPGVYRLQIEPVREHVRWFGPPRGEHWARQVSVGSAPLAWSLVGQETLGEAFAGQVQSVTVTVRNEGTQIWSPNTHDNLSYHWADADGQVVAEGPRTAWPQDIAPGEMVTVTATVHMPVSAGRYMLLWEPVREQVRWFGPAQNDAQRGLHTQVVDVAGPQLGWALEQAAWPARVWAGRETTVRVTVRNDGAQAWSPATDDHLSYRWIDSDGTSAEIAAMRTALSDVVAPGQAVSLDLRVKAPPSPGDWVLQIGMVREYVQWFPPPSGPVLPQRRVTVLRFGPIATAVGLVFVLVLGIALRQVFARQHRMVTGFAQALFVDSWVALVVAAGIYCIGENFVDVSSLEPWQGASWASGTAGAWCAVPLLLVSRRWRPVAGIAMLAGGGLLAVADLAYLEFFGAIVPTSALVAIHHLGDAQASVMSLWHPSYARVLSPWIFMLPLALMRPPAPRVHLGTGATWRPRAAIAAVFMVAAVPSIDRVVSFATSEGGNRVFSERDSVGRLGLWNAHGFELWRTVRRWVSRGSPSEQQRRKVATFFARRQLAAGSRYTGIAQGKNLVVIQAEALQGWVVDAAVDGQLVMPFLHGADNDALRFTSIVDQTAQGRTSDAEYLVLQSGHPLGAGALAFLRADNHFETIAHRLQAQGYTTLSAHPYARGFWNRATLHPRYGFERSLFREEIGDGVHIGWGLSDVAFLNKMAQALTEQQQPFAGFFITLGLHHPYNSFPEAQAELDLRSLSAPQLKNYLQAMRHLDHALAEFFTGLEQAGLRERTVVLVYGDHIANLEYGDELLALAGVDKVGATTDIALHRVPALIWVPGADLHGRQAQLGGQIDLGPTVLDLLGAPFVGTFVGRSLLADTPQMVALPDGSALDSSLIWLAPGRGGRDGGGCFTADGRGCAARNCDELRAAALDELTVSRAVLDYDLYRELSAPISP